MTEYSIIRGAYTASPTVCIAEYTHTPSKVGSATTQKYETDARVVPSSNMLRIETCAIYGANNGTSTITSAGLIAATAPNGALLPVE